MRISLCFALLLCFLTSSASLLAQQPQSSQSPQTDPQVAKLVESIRELQQYNTFVGIDERMFVVMAALNAAGFDVETPGMPPSSVRAQLRKDLGTIDPQLLIKLQSFFKVHVQLEREPEAQATGYIALAFVLGAPPTFTPPADREFLANDVNELFEFAPLVAEFYAKTPVKSLIPKYLPLYQQSALSLIEAVDTQMVEVLSLLHTRPILLLPADSTPADRYAQTSPGYTNPPKDKSADKKKQPEEPAPQKPQNRVRRLFVLPDLLGPANRVYTRNDVLNGVDTITLRRAGDDYLMVVGPHAAPPLSAIRLTLLRFVLEPIVARSGVAVALRRPEIVMVKDTLPNKDRVDTQLQRSVYEIVRESLIRASEARLRRRAATKAQPYGDEDARYDVGTAYERGAVLAYHFYEEMDVLERVGVEIDDLLPKMLASFDAEREKKRVAENSALRARVEKRRGETSSLPAAPTLASRLADADALLRTRQYKEAKPILETILKEDPKNARAVFGLAQILSNTPSKDELDENVEEGDRIAAQEERLARTVEMYRQAISLASGEEKWLVSQAYFLIGRIYDFAELRDSAVEAYSQAIAIGDVPNGAYKQALEGKERPAAKQNEE